MTTLVQGEDREISFGLKDINEDVYIDLTGNTEISVKLNATAGGSVEFTKTATEVVVTDATKGKFKIVITDTKSSLIRLGERDVEVTIDWGTTRRIVQAFKAITVVKRLF